MMCLRILKLLKLCNENFVPKERIFLIRGFPIIMEWRERALEYSSIMSCHGIVHVLGILSAGFLG